MQYIGKIDIEKLGKYKMITNKVIITKERIEHIKRRHFTDYDKYIQYVPDIIEDPDYILEDIDNINTILMLKTIIEKKENIQVVIKLQTNREKGKYNSILTFWKIRDRNYEKVIKHNKIIYKKL